MGTVLSANTLGIIIGPLVGGSLFQYWGYVAPFIFCGILALCCFLVISIIIEPSDSSIDENSIVDDDLDVDDVTQPPSFWNLIADWNIISVCLAIIVVASVLAGMYQKVSRFF
jgi:MFS family permease